VAEPTPAVPLPRPRARPTLLSILAVVGIVLGACGTMYALSSAPLYLGSRDAMVRLYRETAAKSASSLTPADQLELMAEREADVRYRRRNAQLPLTGVTLIVSCLLLAGCSRTLRGQAWGVEAWTLAAMMAIPYQLLDTALAVVQAHDLEAAFITLPRPLNLARLMWLDLQTLGSVLAGGLEILYFAACLIYLRRPAVRALFTRDAERTPPSA
jgi:hypothetical protein